MKENILLTVLLLAPVTSFGADHHCKEGEEVVASCAIAKKKTTASVCASGETLIYRYGVVGGKKIDLEIVAKPGEETVFSGTARGNGGGSYGEHLRFENGDYSYVLSHTTFGPGRNDETEGEVSSSWSVTVFKGSMSNTIASLSCASKPERWKLSGGAREREEWSGFY